MLNSLTKGRYHLCKPRVTTRLRSQRRGEADHRGEEEADCNLYVEKMMSQIPMRQTFMYLVVAFQSLIYKSIQIMFRMSKLSIKSIMYKYLLTSDITTNLNFSVVYLLNSSLNSCYLFIHFGSIVWKLQSCSLKQVGRMNLHFWQESPLVWPLTYDGCHEIHKNVQAVTIRYQSMVCQVL